MVFNSQEFDEKFKKNKPIVLMKHKDMQILILKTSIFLYA